ncbi:MAG: hypothetical protein HUJ74_02930 [Lachnospiraceae bacterium]|nr:hypothetical protein [Lachnospiraceae bacterium]
MKCFYRSRNNYHGIQKGTASWNLLNARYEFGGQALKTGDPVGFFADTEERVFHLCWKWERKYYAALCV